ncbi:MAG TPA: bifunctional 2-acylglycerophosphoethanolamine acyltransferase/acyl-ACP synthetase [Solibacterales bacterium]|nr:bifunctional 2-acylglycerophosphoethanolamine acyltransferase/acyl-ACP synthetase [Bryobacterales bacterium]
MHSVIKLLASILLRIFYRAEVHGWRGARPERLVVIANHQSLLDGVLLGALLPFQPTWVVHTQIWNQWHFRMLLSWLPVVVVDATSPLAVKTLARLVERGEPIMIFPEGRITVTGSLMKIYDGPAFVAARTNAHILPVRIDGALDTPLGRMPSWHPGRLFPKIRLTVLPPEPLAMPEGRTPRERRRLAAEELRRRMQRMMFITEPVTSLHESLLRAVEKYGRGRVMLEDIQRKPQTYDHMLRAVLALGRLVSKMTQPGERVGVLLPSAAVTPSLLFGLFATRRVPAMLNFTAGSEGLQNACTIAGIRLILTSEAFLEKAKLASVVAGLQGVEVVKLEQLRPRFTLGDKLWLILWAKPKPRRVFQKVSPDEPAVVLFTSGSEGKPKGVVLSHRNILSNVNQIRGVIEFNSEDRFFNALPIFHSFGLTAGTLLPLICGCRLFLYPTPLHYRIIPELTYDTDSSVIFGTPTFLANYGKMAHPYDFYKVRFAVAGAEKLNEETRRLWSDKFGIRIIEGYGATECAPVISANTAMAHRAGTVGEILPGIEYRLEPVPGIEKGGMLHVKGPNVMLGYLRADQPGVVQPLEGGWYETGDIVEIEDGFVRIVGRLKRFAKVAGEMVSLEVAERIALAASPLKAHAATAVPDGRRGEVILLYTEDPSLKREDLTAAAARQGAPEIAIARRIVHTEKLPRLGTGKLDYVTLRKMAESTS